VAPTGWSGPLVLYQGPSATSPPLCPQSSYPTMVAQYQGSLDEGTPNCTCTCGAAEGIQCTGSAGLCYAGSLPQSCVEVCTSMTLLPPGMCVSIPMGNGAAKMEVNIPAPTSAGSCSPMSTSTIPMPAFGTAAQLCGGATMTTMGCGTGDVCVPAASGSYSSICVVMPGDVACPDTFYATKNTFYTSFTDGRSCTACTCGAANSECSGTVTFQHSSSGPCALPSQSIEDGTFPAPACAGNYPMGFDSGTYVATPSGTCMPMGGQLAGTVTTNGAATVCCH
jgi:hypothetical protein